MYICKPRNIVRTPLFLAITFFALVTGTTYAQTDSIIFRNGDIMVGEIKSMNNGVLTIETSYSKKDFAIKWSGISSIYSKTRFLLLLKDGIRLNGTISMTDSSMVDIHDDSTRLMVVHVDDIVYIKSVKTSFWSRVRANVDIGLNITKSNNFRQLSVRSALGYTADRWQLDANYNAIYSSQDSVASTRRTDASLLYKYFLQHDWFLSSSINFLSNTEQALQLRTSGQLGAGKMLIHTNRAYWGLGGGLAFNNETFYNETPKRESLEAFAATEINLFDIGDLSLLSSWTVYPSLTEKGRWRSDFKIDSKYDLPLDFYIKAGVTFNYDNRPAAAGKETDYVFIFSFGWELK